MSAEGVCRVMLELAVDHFAEAGKDELKAWGFGTSEQLGGFIHELAVTGAIELSPDDQVNDFGEWFDLEQDPQNWKLQW